MAAPFQRLLSHRLRPHGQAARGTADEADGRDPSAATPPSWRTEPAGAAEPCGTIGTRLAPSFRRPGSASLFPLPVAVLDVDVAEPFPAVEPRDGAGRPRSVASVIVRAFTEPLARLLLDIPPEGMTAEELAAEIAGRAPATLGDRLAAAGIAWDGVLPVGGLRADGTPPFVAARERLLESAPAVTAVVCTRGEAPWLRECLESLRSQRYPHFEVLVVDNAPTGDGNRAIVESFDGPPVVRRVVEPRPGLSWARNRSLDEARHDVIAWMDDDEVADPHWLAELARAFAEHADAGAVSGPVLPAEIDTLAQACFEEWGGHTKGRGFEPAVFSRATARQQSPLYPRPAYGRGCNMAFRRAAIEQIGRFDTALGAGTRAVAGEDTLALSEYLFEGGTVVHQPSALVLHHHVREMRELRDHMFGLGSGVSAFYTSLLVRHPRWLVEVGRAVLSGVVDEVGSLRDGDRRPQVPAHLIAAQRRGLVVGPFNYALSRRRARALARWEPAGGDPS